jgi:hypothetical protein
MSNHRPGRCDLMSGIGECGGQRHERLEHPVPGWNVKSARMCVTLFGRPSRRGATAVQAAGVVTGAIAR